MSGGHWDYQNDHLQNYIFGWERDGKVPNALEDRELSNLVWDVFNLLHDFDWYISCDTGIDTWKRKKKAFKDKWLKPDRSRTKAIVDEAIKDLKEEMYNTFELEDE